MLNEKDISDYKKGGYKQPKTRADRYNSNKPRMELIDFDALMGLAAVLTAGAEKYSAHNWRKGLPVTETLGSLLRHVAALQRGEDIDPETNLPHIDHIGCNWMFLSNFFKHPELYKEFDDRWKPNEN